MGHSVHIQRLVDGQYVSVANQSRLAPGETIRIFVSGVSFNATSVEVVVTNPLTANEIIRQDIGRTPGGDAWLDMGAPFQLGFYEVVVRQTVLLSTHYATANFHVVAQGEEDPLPLPPPEGGIGGFLDKLKWPLLIVFGIVLVNALGKFKR